MNDVYEGLGVVSIVYYSHACNIYIYMYMPIMFVWCIMTNVLLNIDGLTMFLC